MTQRPPSSRDSGTADFEAVMVSCLERLEAGDDTSVDELATEHPEHAPRLRRRVQLLVDAGLVRGARRLGPFELLYALGRGGMGVVHAARDGRDGSLVALKALPGRLAHTPRARARFERELRAAAALRHEHIVPVRDIGEIDGIPYLAMEFVRGHGLAQVLESLRCLGLPPGELTPEHLDIAAPDGDDDEPRPGAPHAAPAASRWERSYVASVTRLVLDVAHALSHAHAHGVLHRDVKPSNVLVSDGRALLLDFGLARSETDESLTLPGDFAGTPSYASPEQIDPRGRRLDARSDVYSLGATLYELLTLQRPHRGHSLQELARKIDSEDPVAPRRLNAAVPPDLEAVTCKALEKDPDRRYDSISAFAADLAAVLAGRPVVARAPSAAARAWRWTRRNPATAAALVLGLVVLAGTPFVLWRKNVAVRAEAEKLAAINVFLERMFLAAHPTRGRSEVTVVEALDEAVRQLDADPDMPIAAAANLRRTIGTTYEGLGRYDAAITQLRAAADLHAAAGDLLGRARAEQELAQSLAARGHDLEEARARYASAAEAYGRLGFPVAQAAVLLDDAALVELHLTDLALAEQLDSEALAILADHPVAGAEERLRGELHLARLHSRSGRLEEAEERFRAFLVDRVGVLPDEHPWVTSGTASLANVLSKQGDHAGAAAIFEALIVEAGAWMGTQHPKVAELHMLYSRVLEQLEDHDRVVEQLERAVPAMRVAWPGGHMFLAESLQRLGNARLAQGRPAEGIPLLVEALITFRSSLGDLHWRTGQNLFELTDALVAAGRADAAEGLLVEFEGVYRQASGTQDHDWLAGTCAEKLAEIRATRGDGAGSRRAITPTGFLNTPRATSASAPTVGAARSGSSAPG